MGTGQPVQDFMKQQHIAVAGVSRSKQKFGNTLFDVLIKKGYSVYPLHPVMQEFKGHKCIESIQELPQQVTGLVISTKPETTEKLVREAQQRGIHHIWLQQGSFPRKKELPSGLDEMNIIRDQCILMFAEPVDGIHGFHRWLKKTFGKLPA